jgi:hypothetical protein
MGEDLDRDVLSQNTAKYGPRGALEPFGKPEILKRGQ